MQHCRLALFFVVLTAACSTLASCSDEPSKSSTSPADDAGADTIDDAAPDVADDATQDSDATADVVDEEPMGPTRQELCQRSCEQLDGCGALYRTFQFPACIEDCVQSSEEHLAAYQCYADAQDCGGIADCLDTTEQCVPDCVRLYDCGYLAAIGVTITACHQLCPTAVPQTARDCVAAAAGCAELPPCLTGLGIPALRPACVDACFAFEEGLARCQDVGAMMSGPNGAQPASGAFAATYERMDADFRAKLDGALGQNARMGTNPARGLLIVWELGRGGSAQRLRELPGLVREYPVWQYGTDGPLAVATRRTLVRFSSEPAHPEQTLKALGARLLERHPLPRTFVVEPLNPEADVFAFAKALSEASGVKWAEVDLYHELTTDNLDDPLLPKQWHTDASNAAPARPNADASLAQAWRLDTGDPSTLIAIVDDGVDITHPDLAEAVVGGIEVPEDLETVRQEFHVSQYQGCCEHGTAVSGVAAARGDNGIGVAGACPSCSIIPVFLLNHLFSDGDSADRWVRATDAGAAVINNSWGNAKYDPTRAGRPNTTLELAGVHRDALEHVERRGRGGLGTVIVFSAGNTNSDTSGLNPRHRLPSTVVVSAVNDQNVKSYYSSFSPSVTVAAPSNTGRTTGIWTTDNHGAPGYNPGDSSKGDRAGDYTNDFGGTSSSAPLVSGVLGLILSARPDLTAEEARTILKQSADPIDLLHGNYDADGHSVYYGYGRVNAYRALRLAMGEDGCVPFDQEECNGIDDTCDGEVDEGCEAQPTCAPCLGDGACGSGRCVQTPDDDSERCLEPCGDGDTCSDGFTCQEHLCVPNSGRCDPCADTETCNGVDDTCDGQADEGACLPTTPCFFDGECSDGAFCLWWRCEVECDADHPCPDEYECAQTLDAYGNPSTSVCFKRLTCIVDLCTTNTSGSISNGFVQCVNANLEMCGELPGCLPAE